MEDNLSQYSQLFIALEIPETEWPPSSQLVDNLWKSKIKYLHPDHNPDPNASAQVTIYIICKSVFVNFRNLYNEK